MALGGEVRNVMLYQGGLAGALIRPLVLINTAGAFAERRRVDGAGNI